MDELKRIFINTIGLTEQHFAEFTRCMHVRKMGKREMLIPAGNVCNFIAFINSGTLRSFVTHDSEERNTDFYFQHYFVSAYSSYITQTPTEHSIETLTESEVYCISRQHYNELVDKDAAWLRFGKYIAENFLIRKCKREVSFLKQTAAERMAGMLAQYPGIEQIVPQYHIASYLGIKPESLSRIKLLDSQSARTPVPGTLS